MIKLEELYKNNQELDEVFSNKYDFNNQGIINKNKLELFCELSEFANSSRCFKYWSNKKNNYQDMLYEYVDGLMMILTFFNIANKPLHFKNENTSDNSVDIFLKLYDLYNNFINHNVDNLEEILGLYLYLHNILNINDDDINEAFIDKVAKIKGEII